MSETENQPWTDQEWEEMTALERLTRLPQELERRSGRLDADELTNAGEWSVIDIDAGNDFPGTAPAQDATGAEVDQEPGTADSWGLTWTEAHAENREDAAEAAGSLLDRLLAMVPTWAWVLGAIVLGGAAFGYTRPLWSVAGGVLDS